MTAVVMRGDAAKLALADNSVDLIMTSPPYFALRSYTDGGKHYDGQIGGEPSAAEYLEALWTATQEWVRVLKPTGSLWVNLGDKYATGTTPPAQGATGIASRERTLRETAAAPRKVKELVRNKSLNGLPWRYAIGCMDYFDLLLRRDQIWAKPNGLPETVTDRTASKHEYWFHFTQQPQYFSALDDLRTPAREAPHARGPNAKANGKMPTGKTPIGNPLGSLPGSVWTIPTESGLVVPDFIAHRRCCGVADPDGKAMKGCDEGLAHYAAFPMEFPRRVISGWSPSAICTGCGQPRQSVRGPSRLSAEGERISARRAAASTGYAESTQTGAPGESFAQRRALSGPELKRHTLAGELSGERCGCDEPTSPTRPAVVLDPFGGTGTVALVAHVMGRLGISNDMSEDYCRLAQWRTSDRGEYARAMLVAKPPKPVVGQETLFDLDMLDVLS